MRKARIKGASVDRGGHGRPVSGRWLPDESELSYAIDRLIRRFGASKAGRTYALRLIGVYALFSEVGLNGFHQYGYTRDQAAYFIKRLQDAGLLTSDQPDRRPQAPQDGP